MSSSYTNIRFIRSVQHEVVKHFVKLRKSRSYRMSHQSIIVDDKKSLLERKTPVKTLLIEKNAPIPPFAVENQVFFVSKEILLKISGLQSSPQYICEMAMPTYERLCDKNSILILDRVQDPGNVGTLIRSASALGWESVFLLGGCADPFSPKVIRSSKGGCLSLPIYQGTQTTLLEWLSRQGVMFIADGSGKSLAEIPSICHQGKKIALLLGNEGQGVCEEFKHLGHLVRVDMMEGVDSLNVSVAGGILMYELGKIACGK